MDARNRRAVLFGHIHSMFNTVNTTAIVVVFYDSSSYVVLVFYDNSSYVPRTSKMYTWYTTGYE